MKKRRAVKWVALITAMIFIITTFGMIGYSIAAGR
mgnify:CR=1